MLVALLTYVDRRVRENSSTSTSTSIAFVLAKKVSPSRCVIARRDESQEHLWSVLFNTYIQFRAGLIKKPTCANYFTCLSCHFHEVRIEFLVARRQDASDKTLEKHFRAQIVLDIFLQRLRGESRKTLGTNQGDFLFAKGELHDGMLGNCPPCV